MSTQVEDDEIRVRTPLGTDTYKAWDFHERDGHLMVQSKDCILAAYAPGQWLTAERVGGRS